MADTLIDYVSAAVGVQGVVTSAVTVLTWMGTDGQEHVAIIRDGSPIAIYGLLQMAAQAFARNVQGDEIV